MGIETVKESSWFSTVWRPSWKAAVMEPEKPVIEIMSFEVSRLMMKSANLWQLLSHKQISRLREELSNSPGTRKLVSDDHDYLMELALLEIIDNIKGIAEAIARLGKNCTDPIYSNLEHVFDNPLEIDVNWYGWEYRLKKMKKRVKKMKRFAAVTLQLYEELEVLSHLENSLRRMQDSNPNQVKLNEFMKKVTWQREEVNGLREMSVWIRTYDYVVRLLLRSLFTIVNQVKTVFGITTSRIEDSSDGRRFCRCNSVSTPSVYPSESSIPRSVSNLGYKSIRKLRILHRLSNSQNPTLGDSALSLHYANVIVFIERLAMSPHFISPEARVDLYGTLTTRIKNSVRLKLSLMRKTEALKVYNCDLASDWCSSMQKTLDWLAPLAHNMIKWHSERNIEMQRMSSGGNVLLVNTLHYADQAKSEDAITELVLGLHYVSRFGREINDKAFMGNGCAI